jgi:hypothetical protein
MQQIVQLDAPGIYRVQPFGEASYRVAAVVDPAECDFSYRPPSVPEWNRRHVKVLTSSGLREFLERRRGAALMTVLWILLGALLVLEMLLWEWRGERDESPVTRA